MTRPAVLAALAVAALLAVAAPASAGPKEPGKGKGSPGVYEVGVASRSINPDPDGTFAGRSVYLGGYGVSSGAVLNQEELRFAEGRKATGILEPGVRVHAFVVGDGRRTAALVDIDSQGWFVAVKQGPYGLLDMRKRIEAETDGRLPAERVVIQTNHTHGGPDGIGVWGGVPTAYMRHVADRTVAAAVDAYERRRRGRLRYGVAEGRDLLSNQFDYDEANESLDDEVRVLQARHRGRAFATLLNFSAHSTVLGSDNTLVTADWPGPATELLEQRFGGSAVVMMGTLGRTQPADRGCPGGFAAPGGSDDACSLRNYATRVVDRAAAALDGARPLRGRAVVDARSYLVTDAATNAPILGLELAGDAAGAPLARSLMPPWLAGNVLGTSTASVRIGDVLLSAGPGEMYPQIPLTVRELVPARGHMTAGLANDQLGYLIAPYEAYPEPIRRSFFNQRGDEVSPIDNDNYFFNVSHTMGERITCSLLRGAGEVLGAGTDYRSRYQRCAPFANDLALAHGADAAAPSGFPTPVVEPAAFHP